MTKLELGQDTKRARTAAGMTQKTVAQVNGLEWQVVSAFERGQSPVMIDDALNIMDTVGAYLVINGTRVRNGKDIIGAVESALVRHGTSTGKLSHMTGIPERVLWHWMMNDSESLTVNQVLCVLDALKADVTVDCVRPMEALRKLRGAV